MTRSEFISLIIRSFYDLESKEKLKSDHWFIRDGYLKKQKRFRSNSNEGLWKKF